MADATINYASCLDEAYAVGEQNDCVVRACAVATQIEYRAMRDYLATYGRKPGRGMRAHDYIRALKDLGCTITELPAAPNMRTFVTACRNLPKTGAYLLRSDTHCACLYDGALHDWAQQRRLRVRNIWQINI